MILSIVISFLFVFKHFTNYSTPFFQDKIIGFSQKPVIFPYNILFLVILFMAPFYAITSYFGIIFADASVYFVLMRDIYEGFFLFTFFYLIFSYLAYEPSINNNINERVYMILIRQKEVHHLFPLNWFNQPYQFTKYNEKL